MSDQRSSPGPLEPEACEELLAIAAHEIRTPLTTLILQIQLAMYLVGRPGRDAAADERIVELLQSCNRQTRRMDDLLSSLLDASRLRLGRMSLNPEELDLAELAQTVADRMQEDLTQAKSALLLTAPVAVRGTWDRGRIEQALANLLANAIKYGCGRAIHLTVEPSGTGASITVRDHGEGLDAAEQAALFQRFQRGARHQGHPGAGLGLYIVRSLLEAMGGSVEVRSRPGDGAAFVIQLPRELPPR